jgi:hypothetical protein
LIIKIKVLPSSSLEVMALIGMKKRIIQESYGKWMEIVFK